MTAALIAWYFFAIRQDFTILYRDLRPTEAAAIVAELEEQSVPYRLADGGGQILVPRAQMDATRVKLASSATPLGSADGFELFDGSDLGLTEFAQKIRYQRALQGELSRTIMMMEEVAEARVHLSIPERTLFRGERRNAKAAVTLVMRSEGVPTAARIEGVQRLVAAAVADLAVNDVVILNARGEILSSHTDATGAAARRYSPGAAAATLPSLDRIIEAIRTAIPDRAFEVSLQPTPAELIGAEQANASEAATPYVVSINTPTPLPEGTTETIANALRDAGLVDHETGGTISFQSSPNIEAPERANLSNARTPAAPTASYFSWTSAAVLALLLASLAAAGFWCWQRYFRARLSNEERSKFADLLRSELRVTEHEGA